METKFENFKQVKEELNQAIVRIKHEETKKIRHGEAETEEIKLRKRIKEELIIQEKKLKRRSQLMRKLPGTSPIRSDREVKVKLPKSEITNFNGTHLDWTRFWNQFSVEIVCSRLASVTKLSYLKEFPESKVTIIIDGIPFRTKIINSMRNCKQMLIL